MFNPLNFQLPLDSFQDATNIISNMSPRTPAERAQAALENRKLRNRLSQKAFRARQSIRIKELEDILATRPFSEAECIAELESRNKSLLDQLMTYHKKLESIQITLKTLTDSTAISLGMNLTELVNKKATASPLRESESTKDGNTELQIGYLGGTNTDFRLENEDLVSITPHGTVKSPTMSQGTNFTHQEEQAEEQALGTVSISQTDTICPWSFDDNMFDDPSFQLSSTPVLTGNSSYPYPLTQFNTTLLFSDMGPRAFLDTVAKGPILVKSSHGHLRRTNSVFSDHFNTVEYFLRQKLSSSEDLWNNKDEFLQKAASFMLSVFVCLSWQKMTPWHTWTAGNFGAGHVMAWRLNPTETTFAKLPTHFRPTQSQLCIPHPTVIDWIPWPEIRDKLIHYHSSNPYLDEIIREIGNCYVVETDLSRLVVTSGPVMGFVSVWDIVRAISPEATFENSGSYRDSNQESDTTFYRGIHLDQSSPSSSISEIDDDLDQTCSLPAPNLASLFSSKAFAIQTFRLLNMEKAENLRLHPSFFENHPELADCRRNLMARGVSLRPPHQVSVPSPQALESNILGMYREFTMHTLESSLGYCSGANFISVN